MSVRLHQKNAPAERPLVGVSDWVRRTRAEILRVAPFGSSIFITGPSGTGKEVIARAVHRESSRSERPFIAVNCAAVTGPLFESHMFGHLKGAFTGANFAALGCFRAADGGTLFLDEVGELDPDMQAKMLRVLQEGAVTPVGSHQELPVNVRIVAATNRNLAHDLASGSFRSDLYYRLAVVTITASPLCERIDDMEVLAQYLLSRQAIQHGVPFKPLAPSALGRLRRHNWPGNVRELSNVLERAAMLARGDVIESEDIVFDSPSAAAFPWTGSIGDSSPLQEVRFDRNSETTHAAAIGQPHRSDLPVSTSNPNRYLHPGEVDGQWMTMAEIERWHIALTLEYTGYNQTAAARVLEMDRSVLRRRIKRYGLDTSESTPGRPRKPR